ncbi:MAG: GNAT family N-acetyltransferase [Myxococcales bacterium]
MHSHDLKPQDLLARAFHHDPYISWAEPDGERRPRTMSRVFGGMLNYAKTCGGHLFEPGVGSVHWRDGAAADMGPLSVATSGTWRVALVAPPAVWYRLAAHEGASMARVQPFLGKSSVYLCTMGIEPTLAGQGHGSRLLSRALDAMTRRWRTCVLRTEQPKNVPFYLRNGFSQVDEQVVPESGLRSGSSRARSRRSGPERPHRRAACRRASGA